MTAKRILATGRFDTDRAAGYAAMRRHVAAWPDRTGAVEGSNGAGRPSALRLLADGEQVVDVPAKLAARARLFDTGHDRKTDAHDARNHRGLGAEVPSSGASPSSGGSSVVPSSFRTMSRNAAMATAKLSSITPTLISSGVIVNWSTSAAALAAAGYSLRSKPS
jgi:hypothetical protein